VVSGLLGAGRARERGDDAHPQVVPPTAAPPTSAGWIVGSRADVHQDLADVLA
jgi:hypothetical protein